MGWNSWDCYGTTVTEEEVLANTAFVRDHLLAYGWDTDGHTRYAAVFSLADAPRRFAVPLGSVGTRPDARARELWTRTDTPHDGRHLHVGLPAHGAALYRLIGARPGASRG
jgi:hypothetical protein